MVVEADAVPHWRRGREPWECSTDIEADTPLWSGSGLAELVTVATRTKKSYRHGSWPLGQVEIFLIVGMVMFVVLLVWWLPSALR